MVDKENALGSGFMTISPPAKLAPHERKAPPAMPEEATLMLKKFAETPWVVFGDVTPGASSTSSLHLVNPGNTEVHLTLEHFPAVKGFAVEGFVNDVIVVAPGNTSTLTLRWTPTGEGKINERFDLKWRGKNKLQVRMIGTGVVPTEEKAKGKGRGRGKGKGKGKGKVKPLSTRATNTVSAKLQGGTKAKTQPTIRAGPAPKKPLKSVAKSSTQPVLTKPNQKSKMPSKARNANSGGDQAVDKQERCFTKWLSHILAPSNVLEPHKLGKDNPANPAMTQDEMQQLRLRQRMFQLMVAPEVRACVSRLKEEVGADRIATISADVSLHKNVLVHNQCLECVMNYTPEWLRLGLEAVFNERCISNQDEFLSTFVKQKLLYDNDKAAASALDGRQSAVLNQHTTLLMLTLVFVLDRAKTARILDNGPSLFKTDGTIKSSSEMIHRFFDGVLSGGGDLLRQLHHIGYSVAHVQSALEEYPLAVSNITTDLQDGVLLCKLAEMLTNDSSVMDNVKCPANSKAVMKHNVNLALAALQKTGCNVKLCARPDDIINGRQDRTLSLLWNVMMHWQILDMIDADALSAEVERVRHWHRDSVSSRRSSIASDSGIVDTDLYMNCEKLGLLLLWCRGVCARYGVRVHNFTSSFSDGRVLCVLLHHYHPELLSLEDISGRPKKQVTLDPAEFEDDSYEGNIESSGENFVNFFIPLDTDHEDEPDLAMECKTSNFQVLQSRIMELGGIPNIITTRDMVNGAPDEKVVITYVTYLSSRLLDIQVQVEAARAISRHWKAHFERVKLRESSAVQCIQRAARARFGFKPVNHINAIPAAALKIQRMWRGFSTREQVLPVIRAQLVSVDLLQATFRSFMQRKAYKLVVLAVTTMQSMRRMKTARAQFVQTTQAARTVQRLYRGNRDRAQAGASKLLAQAAQATQEHEASTIIQAQFRACSRRNSYMELRTAAIKVQAAVRCSQARTAYSVTSAAAIVVQTAWKGHVARKAVATLKAVVRFQAVWRGNLIRCNMAQKLSAAATLQAAYRAHCARMSYKSVMQAVSLIQSIARSRSAKRHYEHARSACVVIQTAFRGHHARKAVANVQQCRAATVTASVTTIQAQFRACSRRNSYMELRTAAIKVQAAVRCSQARTAYSVTSAAAIVVQTAQRRYAARKALQAIRAMVRFQALWRGVVARRTLEQFGIAATIIQAQFRACSRRNSYMELRTAAIKVQAAVRCSQARTAYSVTSAAAIVVQTAWKTRFDQKLQQQQQQQQQEQQAAAKIQAYYRTHIRNMESKMSDTAATAVVQHTEAATRIQRACRGWAGRKQASRHLRHVVSVQRIYRGHAVRQNTTEEVTAVRQRLHELSANFDPTDTLERRTNEALAILSNTAILGKIIPAIDTLATVTRLSAQCCKNVVDEDAVHIVLRLVRACNRSTSHMDLLKSALDVLYNLCKHRSTCKAVFAVNASVEIFAELMQLYRDKSTIFIQACTILRTMCKIDSQRKAIIAMKDIVKRIEGIYHILELKYNREAEHCAHLDTEGDARGNETMKQLEAQLRSTAKFMGYLRTKPKDPECRKLRI